MKSGNDSKDRRPLHGACTHRRAAVHAYLLPPHTRAPGSEEYSKGRNGGSDMRTVWN